MAYLPDEILCMICTQLWHQRDFNTLFNCACSGKQLAVIAIMNLYRVQGVAVEPPGDSEEDTGSDSDHPISAHARLGRNRRKNYRRAKRLSRDPVCRKSAGLWRSIILSSLNKTLYPYSRYIRALNLRDLDLLLTNEDFGDTTRINFFQGELASFNIENLSELDVEEAINNIGEVITKQTPLLEALVGNVPSEVLSGWIPRLPRLTNLETSHGTATKDIGTLLRLYCPLFNELHLRNWHGNNSAFDPSGQRLATFLNELRPQSIKSFDPFMYKSLGLDIFRALTRHEESLVELKLNLNSDETMLNLALLKGCTNLVSLSLDGDRFHCFSELEKSAKSELFTWLMECKKLQKFASSGCSLPPWITPVLLKKGIHLTSLECECTEMCAYKTKFFRGLARQTSLQKLWLKGPIYWSPVEPAVLVKCLSKLVNLTNLRLDQISEPFTDWHIEQLASSLPKLQDWSTRGLRLTDAIWNEIATLESLRRLELRTSVRFTADGIMDFICQLGPGNHGLFLYVIHEDDEDEDKEDEEKVLTWEEQDLIQEEIATELNGKFKFPMWLDIPW